MKLFASWLVAALIPLSGIGQVVAPNGAGVSMGHLHLNAKDPEAQKKFWMEIAGAQAAKLGPLDVLKLRGVIVFINKAEPAGGTDGSVVNHVGLLTRDLKAAVARAEAAQIKVINQNDKEATLSGPDEVRLELNEDKANGEMDTMHHIHFFTTDVEGMRAWYVKTFGAVAGKRGSFQAADLPGVNLTFVKRPGPLAGTKGRALDHIGFEVRNLEAFAKNLEQEGVKFDVAYRKVPRLGIAIAFFTDPWGTYIELTEGLTQVQ